MKSVCEVNKLIGVRPKHSLKRAFSIQEQAIMGHAEKIKKYTNGKVKFNAILQTAGDTNQNKRMYPLSVLEDGIQRIDETIQKRNLIGELDHPISDNQVRQTTVLYSEASHLITQLEFRGNQLWGEIETLPYTPKGKILSGLILDNISVGFSLRGLADLEDNGDHQRVLAPLVIIGWDSVQNQSHKKASIQEIHQESVKVINESTGIIQCSDGVCYLANTFDTLVESKIINLHSEYWKKW